MAFDDDLGKTHHIDDSIPTGIESFAVMAPTSPGSNSSIENVSVTAKPKDTESDKSSGVPTDTRNSSSPDWLAELGKEISGISSQVTNSIATNIKEALPDALQATQSLVGAGILPQLLFFSAPDSVRAPQALPDGPKGSFDGTAGEKQQAPDNGHRASEQMKLAAAEDSDTELLDQMFARLESKNPEAQMQAIQAEMKNLNGLKGEDFDKKLASFIQKKMNQFGDKHEMDEFARQLNKALDQEHKGTSVQFSADGRTAHISDRHDKDEKSGKAIERHAFVSREGEPVIADLSKLVQLNQAPPEGCQPPYLREFGSGDRRFDYIAASHNPKDGTNEMVQQQFWPFKSKSEQPDYVIVEGFPAEKQPWNGPSAPESPPKTLEDQYNDFKEKWAKDPLYRPDDTFPESLYMAFLARANGIPVVGGDMSNGMMHEELANAKDENGNNRFTPEDLMYYKFAEQLGWDARTGALPPAKYNGNMEEYLQDTMRERQDQIRKDLIAAGKDPKDLPKFPPVTYEGFKEWYKQNATIDQKFSSVDEQIKNLPKMYPNMPGAKDENCAAHQIHMLKDQLRNEYSSKLMAGAVNEHKHVVALFGWGHYEDEKHLLKKMLGKADPEAFAS